MSSVIDRAREALSDTEFPAQRNTLLERATEHGDADEDVLHALTVLPEGVYSSLDEVAAGLAADHERGEDGGSPTSAPMDIISDDD
ncbi:DUF2795 domain-containing protein [Actinomycetospora atypica]|uniref:DUF2795 domain-containing protein n=1 Tax=Actinomycetospora atypica TaxID=1290095 RepID=A0ABV9YID6_9PSEU